MHRRSFITGIASALASTTAIGSAVAAPEKLLGLDDYAFIEDRVIYRSPWMDYVPLDGKWGTSANKIWLREREDAQQLMNGFLRLALDEMTFGKSIMHNGERVDPWTVFPDPKRA